MKSVKFDLYFFLAGATVLGVAIYAWRKKKPAMIATEISGDGVPSTFGIRG